MATYYVSTATGNNGDDGLSEANAWATIDHAMNTVVAGDFVYVKNDGAYTETATIDTNGTGLLPITFEGYASTPGDGGQVSINGGASRASGIVDSLAAGARYYIFKNFTITNHTSHGVNTDGTHLFWKNCRFNSNGTTSGHGYNGAQAMFESCQFNNNTLNGADINTTGAAVFVGCKFHNNVSDGIDAEVGVVCYCCEFFGNGDEGIDAGKANDAGGLLAVFNCTFDGDGDDGLNAVRANATTNRAILAVVNCILYDTQTGVTGNFPVSEPYIGLNNLVNSNSVAAYAGFDTTAGEQTGAPAFTDEATNDYSLTSSSPAVDTGFDLSGGMDIGAHQTIPTGGGGASANKRGNKQ